MSNQHSSKYQCNSCHEYFQEHEIYQFYISGDYLVFCEKCIHVVPHLYQLVKNRKDPNQRIFSDLSS